MNKLVFLAPNDREPFTTSDVIADMTGVEHRKLKVVIRKHERDLKSFGLLASYQAESSGGRPQEYYKLNEQQATFLMTLLKNTPVVVAFKMELVRQFYAMRQELIRCNAVKIERRAIRRNVTDAINALPDSPHKAWKYKQYTDLVYTAAVGKTARQLRKERGAVKDATASDYMSSAELEAVSDAENRVGVLIEAGLDYQQVKAALLKTKKATA